MKKYTKEQTEIYELKNKCHTLIDSLCKTKEQKQTLYNALARKLKMRPQDCHISLLDKPHLQLVVDWLIKRGGNK